MKSSINSRDYLQAARNMHRYKSEQLHKNALVECFSADFSTLDSQQQQQMKSELIKEMNKIKNTLHTTKSPETIKMLKKDWTLFSLLAKELNLKNTPTLTGSKKREKYAKQNNHYSQKKETTSWKQQLGELESQGGTNKKHNKKHNKKTNNTKQKDSKKLHETKEDNSLLPVLSNTPLIPSPHPSQPNLLPEKYNPKPLKQESPIYLIPHQPTRKPPLILTPPFREIQDVEWEEVIEPQEIIQKQTPKKQEEKAEQHQAKQKTKKTLTPISSEHPDKKTPLREERIEAPITTVKETIPSSSVPTASPEEETISVMESQHSPRSFTLDAVISNTLTTHKEEARLTAEEALKAEYAKVNKWNVFKKAQLFLTRGKLRKEYVKDAMDRASQSAFGNEVENAASRHAHENSLGVNAVQEQAIVNIPEVNQLARDFLENKIDESAFQTYFDALCNRNPQLQQALGSIEYKGTDILAKLKLEKEQYQLINELAQTLEQGGDSYAVQDKLEAFIMQQQQNPDFLKAIRPDLDAGNLDNLKQYFKHQSALRKMMHANLEIKLSILNGGKSAYQINNADREKGRVYKLGEKLDKIPRYLQVPGYAGAGVLLGLAGGPLGLGVVGTSLLTTGTFAATSGFTNFIKKRTHHTKEQNTHEKNLTHDFDLEQRKISKRQEQLELKGAKNRWKKYRAKRQLELYHNTTQKDIVKTQAVIAPLLSLSTALRPLTESEKQTLTNYLIQGKTRLDAYYQTGHNFLASYSADQVESDMHQLHKALSLGAEKLGITYDEINHASYVTERENLTYDEVKNSLLSDYTGATQQFRKQRAILATKYGVGSAALSAGTALGMQYMLGTGAFSTDSTLETINSTTNASGNANFNLGSHNLVDGNNIQSTVANQFSGLSDNAHVVANYGAGTDATLVRAGSALSSPEAYQGKINSVMDQIKDLALSADQKNVFLKELSQRPWEADWSKAFTNDYLQGDRCAEGLLQMAKGLAASGNQTLVPDLAYDAGRSIAGTLAHNATERSFNIGMQITEEMVTGQSGSGSTRFVPVMSFFNTFKNTGSQNNDNETTNLSRENYTIQHPEENTRQTPLGEVIDQENNPETELKEEKSKSPENKINWGSKSPKEWREIDEDAYNKHVQEVRKKLREGLEQKTKELRRKERLQQEIESSDAESPYKINFPRLDEDKRNKLKKKLREGFEQTQELRRKERLQQEIESFP